MRLPGLVTLAILAALQSVGAQAVDVSSKDQTQTQGPTQGESQSQGLNLGTHDSNAPINVTSDNFEGDLETKVGTYVGNVVVTQADYKLRADKVRVEIVKGDPNKFFAYGKVVFDSPKGIATGDDGIYDLNPPRTITLTGNVVLTKQKDVMRGTKLVVNLVTGDSHLTAHGMPGGRVTSLFVPKQQPAKSNQQNPPKNP